MPAESSRRQKNLLSCSCRLRTWGRAGVFWQWHLLMWEILLLCLNMNRRWCHAVLFLSSSLQHTQRPMLFRRLAKSLVGFCPLLTYTGTVCYMKRYSQVCCAIICYALRFQEKELKQSTSSRQAWPQEHKQPIKYTHTHPHTHTHIINSYLWGTWKEMAGTIKP